MTSLDPTHLPGLHLTEDRSTGQAVRTSVPAPPHAKSEKGGQEKGQEGEGEGEVSALRTLSEKLAHADRARREKRDGHHHHIDSHSHSHSQGRRRRRRSTSSDDSSSDNGEGEGDRVPIPPIPDLRFEQGVLASIRPFIHRVSPRPTATSSASIPSSSSSTSSDNNKEKLQHTAEETVLATTNLTAEGPAQAGEGGKGEVNVFDLREGVRVEWGRVVWVLGRDQVIFPLLQGVLWALGGYYLSAFWSWNRARLDASAKGLPRPSLLRSLGIRTGY